ncbi:MAG: universal stress protein [Desulfobacteraceae bacterium]|jgi:nucleotide-binding universal stress UspA family protein
MEPIKKILFPVDFSDVSPKIAPWVLMMAEKFEAEIHLLFVARGFGYLSDVYVMPVTIENIQGEIIKGGETAMDEFVAAHFEKYPALKAKVDLGDPGDRILKYISSEGIDLVIMGTHGRKGLERVFFGSVADRVIKMSQVPVLSINPHKVQTS